MKQYYMYSCFRMFFCIIISGEKVCSGCFQFQFLFSSDFLRKHLNGSGQKPVQR